MKTIDSLIDRLVWLTQCDKQFQESDDTVSIYLSNENKKRIIAED